MANGKSKYIVTNLNNGVEYATMAVSEMDAINNIHYNLWFKEGIWTEMNDFKAIPECVLTLREIIREHDLKPNQSQYHQMTLFEVAYDS